MTAYTRLIYNRIQYLAGRRRILFAMCLKRFKAKYVSTFLGIAWNLIGPVTMAIFIYCIFTIALKIKQPFYAFQILCGLLPWGFFSASLYESVWVIERNIPVLRQFNVPKEFFPLSAVSSSFLNYMVSIFFLFPVFAWIHWRMDTSFIIAVVGFFFASSLLLLFTAGLSLLLSCSSVFFKDTMHCLYTVMMVWIWVTPIFYNPDMIPYPYRIVCFFNPMTYFICLVKDTLFFGRMPSCIYVIGSCVLSLVSFISGIAVFSKYEGCLLKRV